MTINVPLDAEQAGLLQLSGKPVGEAARELYCQGRISSVKAADLPGMARLAFIQYSSGLSIPFLDMSEQEWNTEAGRAGRH